MQERMTAFEVVFALLTMIASLALAHLLNGFVIVLRNNFRRLRPRSAEIPPMFQWLSDAASASADCVSYQMWMRCAGGRYMPSAGVTLS
jgi:hypothetical protein